MKKFFWMVAAATALFASCAKDATTDVLPAPEATEDFTATFDMSRAELDGTVVKWNDEDLITIFTKTNHNRQYKANSLTEDKRSAKFSYTNVFTQGDGSAITANYAVYPYDAEATISGNEITTKINAEQVYDANKVDLSNSLMVAKSSNLTLSFVNAGGLLRFKVAKENLPDVYTLKSIKVVSANNLAGKVTIDTGADSKAVVVAEGASKSVELTNIDVEIKYQDVQMFYLALPATNFAEGDKLYFTFAVNGDEQTLWEKEITLPAFELKQNAIKTISYTIKAEDFEGVTPGHDLPLVETAKELADALANPNIDEVTLLNDITVDEPLVVKGEATRAAARTVTLNLNGYTITGNMHKSVGHVLTNNVDLTIIGGTIISACEGGGSAIYNNGTLTIEEATIKGATRGADNVAPAYPINNYGPSMYMKNVTASGVHGVVATAAAGTTIVENCTFTKDNLTANSSHVFYINHLEAEVIVNGGTYTHNGGDGSLAYVNKGAITANEGTFSTSNGGYGMAVLNGTITINGGTFSSAANPLDWGGDIFINGGTFAKKPTVAEGYKAVLVNGVYVVVAGETEVISTIEDLKAAIAAGETDLHLAAGTYEGLVEVVNKTGITLTANGDATIKGMLWVDTCEATFKGINFTNPDGVQHPNPSNSQYYKSVNEQYPLVGAYNNANVRFENCTFDIVGPTVYGFYGYAHNTPEFIGCTFNCNHIRPIASNGDSMTIDGCTFNDQYHYSVRIFENNNERQTVIYTNNKVLGTPAAGKAEFEGINISKKGQTATVFADFTINGNTAGLKFRHHKNVTMDSSCTYNSDIEGFAFEKEE